MAGWQWFWTLVGFVLFIIALIFLYFFKPFEELFTLVIRGIGYHNVIFWIAVIIAIVGFCGYHWRAYQVHLAIATASRRWCSVRCAARPSRQFC
jgi:hypothetical protein